MGRPPEDVAAGLRKHAPYQATLTGEWRCLEAASTIDSLLSRIGELEGAHKRVGEALLSLGFMDAVERGDLVGARRVVNRAALSERDDG